MLISGRSKAAVSMRIEAVFIELQKNIAENAFRCLKPGGRMMYSTCTLNKNENEELAKHLLSSASGSALSIEMQTIMPYNGEVGFFYSIIEKTC